MVDAAYGGPPIDAEADRSIMVDAVYGGPPPHDGGPATADAAADAEDAAD